jgi:hypothetical protein
MMSDWIVTSSPVVGSSEDQQGRFADQGGHGDHRALRHAAGEFVRIPPGPTGRLGMETRRSASIACFIARNGATAMLELVDIGQLAADGNTGFNARASWNTMLISATADLRIAFSSRPSSRRREQNATRSGARAGWLDAKDRQSDERLAASGLADHGGECAFLQVTAHLVQHRREFTGRRAERPAVILDFEQFAAHRRRLGSVRSEMASPSR